MPRPAGVGDMVMARTGPICFFLHAPEAGGAQRRTLQLAGGLAALGQEVELLVVGAEGALAGEVPPSVPLVALDTRMPHLPWVRDKRRRRMRAAIPALADYLRQRRPRALVAAANHAHFTALAARRLSGTGTPLVLRVTNALREGRAGLGSTARRVAAGWSYGGADALTTVAPSLAAEVVGLVPALADRTRFLPDPIVDDDLLAKGAAEPGPEWPAAGQGPVILGVGRLVPQKDMATLVRAFARLRQRRPARLLVLGDGPERGMLEALARELGVAADVRMPGFCANPFPAMRKANAFVLSSRWEGLPGALVEAMALGCPVASTDYPGARYMLEDGRLGPLTPPGDPDALAAALEGLLDRPTPADLLRSAVAPFTVEAASRAALEMIDLAVARRGR